jgi:hypothetical protein
MPGLGHYFSDEDPPGFLSILSTVSWRSDVLAAKQVAAVASQPVGFGWSNTGVE